MRTLFHRKDGGWKGKHNNHEQALVVRIDMACSEDATIYLLLIKQNH